MTQSFSADLRGRVIEAAMGGMSARAAAARFRVGVSTAIVWVRRFRQSGEAVARRQGKPRGSRLDAHETFILDLIEVQDDMTAMLCVWLKQRGMTHKKRRRMQPSRTGPTF
jgi:transposase